MRSRARQRGGQRNYDRIGGCEERLAPHVRQAEPTDKRVIGWRPIDLTRNRYPKWANRADHKLWDSVKNEKGRCDYYWLPSYWLARRQA